MTMTADPITDIPEPIEPIAPATVKKFRKRGVVTKWLAIIWLVLLTITAFGADWVPWVEHCSQEQINSLSCSSATIGSPLAGQKPPTWATFSDPPLAVPGAAERVGWFGTDRNGYDLFSRAMYGARASLIIGVASIVFGILIGGALGLWAGFKGGKVDRILETIMNVILAFPALLLIVFIVGFFSNSDPSKAENRSLVPVIASLVILAIPPLQKLVRANTMVYTQREFVTAARSLGASSTRIVVKEILPNVIPTILSFALTGMAILIVAEGALAYLGLSVNSPTPTWGAMIYAGSGSLETAWWISIMPAATMFVTILSINLLGDVLAEKFRVREAIG